MPAGGAPGEQRSARRDPVVALGVDPPNGWGVVRGDAYLAHGHFAKVPTTVALAQRVDETVRLIVDTYKPEVLIIEDQHVALGQDDDGKRRYRLDTGIRLAQKTGLWIQAWCVATEFSKSFHVVGTRELRRAVLGASIAKAASDEAKSSTLLFVNALYKLRLINAEMDAAEALVMARYGSLFSVTGDDSWD